MLGHFPIPYDDEIFYSVCARFAERLSFPTVSAVLSELFGTEHARTIFDLPAHLAHFIETLPPFHPLEDEGRLIYFNTFFPYYQGFMSLPRQTLLWKAMLSGKSVPSRLIDKHMPSSKAFRFCKQCVRADQQRDGECYWHRIHQLPGVLICPQHLTPLWQVEALAASEQQYRREYFSAERVIRDMHATQIWIEPDHKAALLAIAQNTQWLLNNGHFVGGPEITQQRYHFLLIKRGFATNRLIHRMVDFQDEFQHYFPPGLLTLLHSDLPDSPHNWLAQLVRPDQRVQHPLRHLLLLDYFGLSVEEFLRVPVEYLPFGPGPWRCWKPRTEHFGQPTITDYQLVRERGNNYSGIFTCPLCGHSYKWHGPDQTPSEQYQISIGANSEPTWEERFRRLWRNPRVDPNEIAIRLGVDIHTLISEAERLMPGTPPAGARPPGSRGSIPIQKRRTKLRNRWLKLRHENPNADLTTLNKMENHTYNWLSAHDPEWLEENRPPRQSKSKSNTHTATTPARVDWKALDAQLAPQIYRAAQQIRNQPGKPERVTRARLNRRIELPVQTSYKLNRLPRTRRAMASVTESGEDLALRRIWWAEAEFRRENHSSGRSKFIAKASLDNYRKIPRIMDAVNAALERLSRINTLYCV